MMVWCESAPQYGRDTNEDIIAFISKYLTCSKPPDDDSQLQDLILLQTPCHTHACRKKSKKECRFKFPKPPMHETTILETLSAQTTETKMPTIRIGSKFSPTLNK